MVLIVELSIVPIGSGSSVSRLVAEAIKEIERHRVKYELTAMSTIYEAASLAEAFKIARAAHEAVLRAGAVRLITTVKVDDRIDVNRKHMKEKVDAVRKISGKAKS
jgi:uncharacterized protein (TIGR00106 family)